MRFLYQQAILLLTLSALALPSTPALAQQTSVPITWHRQEHALSCEIATLKMALGSHGFNVTEQELLTQMPFDQTARRAGVWGDPHQGFVGDIDGRMLRTGYGVYWEPIAKLGNRYVHTKILERSSTAEVAHFVAAGDPVIIWGHYGTPTIHSWHTPAGKPIRAVSGEHTRVVYGFDGPAGAPTRFYLMDPLVGPMSWSTAELMANWSSFNHSAVAVTHHPRWARVPGDSKVWEIDSAGKTRRWVTTWATLIARGGAKDRITSLGAGRLNTYSVAPPLE